MRLAFYLILIVTQHPSGNRRRLSVDPWLTRLNKKLQQMGLIPVIYRPSPSPFARECYGGQATEPIEPDTCLRFGQKTHFGASNVPVRGRYARFSHAREIGVMVREK